MGGGIHDGTGTGGGASVIENMASVADTAAADMLIVFQMGGGIYDGTGTGGGASVI